MVRRNLELQIYHCRLDGVALVLAIQDGINNAQVNHLFAPNPLDSRDTEASSQITIAIPLAILAHARPDLVHQGDLDSLQGSSNGGCYITGTSEGREDVIDLT